MTGQLELTEPTIKKSGKKWKVTCPACGDVGTNTTEAYATEAAAAHVTEAHPDWAVQTIDRPAAVLELLDIPTDRIFPSPHNPRAGAMGDMEGLKASIAADGIIQPLVVEPDDTLDDGEPPAYRLVAGERRWTAAVELGLATVPAIVRASVDDDHRLELMLIENCQREDVSPMGEARAYRQLEGLGLSQRTIAARIGVSQSHISKRLTLLDLPAAVQKRVGLPADDGGITVAAALELTKLKDDPKAITAITKPKTVDTRDISWKVEQAQREAAAKAKIEELKSTAKAKGWTVVKYDGYNLPKTVKRISTSEYDFDLKVDGKKHQTESCHGIVVVDYNGRPSGIPVCIDPKRHGAKGDSDLKVPVDKKPKLSPSEQRRKDEERAKKAASARRTAHLVELFGGGAKVKQADVWELVAEAAIAQLNSEEKKVLCHLLGVPYSYGIEDVWKLAETDLVRVAGAAALARLEQNGRWSYGGFPTSLYVYLQQHGYEPDEWERAHLDQVVVDDEERSGIRERLVAMAESVAADAETRAVWVQVATTVDEDLIVEFFGDPDDDTPVDEIGDDTIAGQAFAEFFADEIASLDTSAEPELAGAVG